MNSENNYHNTYKDPKIRATGDLIESISNGSLSFSSTAPLAMRIMESSIGCSSRKGDSDALMQKTRKQVQTFSCESQVAQDVEKKIEKIEKLYGNLRHAEGDEMANKIMILLNRLSGTKTDRKVEIPDWPIRNNASANKKIDELLDEGCLTNQIHEASRNNKSDEKKTMSKSNLSSSMYNQKHVQLAVNHEERELLRECIYALQNVDGDYIRFYREEKSKYTDILNHEQTHKSNMAYYEGIRVRPGLLPFNLDLQTSVDLKSTRLLGSGAMDALRICCEAGWLYSKIQSYIDLVLNTEQSSCSSGYSSSGIVSRAFASALSKQLNSYFVFLSSLEQHLPSNSPFQLTSRKIVALVRNPLIKLRIMAVLTDGINPKLSGGELLSALLLHVQHGDLRHAQLVEELLSATALPWYDMLYNWTIFGTLFSSSPKFCNSRGEFFIEEDLNVTDDHMWHDKYKICQHQIPHLVGLRNGILDIELARESLDVGKGINFIRRCLRDKDWNIDLKMIYDGEDGATDTAKRKLGYYYNPAKNAGQTNGSSIFTQTPLERTITNASRQVHNHILTSLFEKHHLLQHLQGLKDFLLLGQGDFICALMDRLNAEFELKKDTNNIYAHNLMGVIHDALRESNAKFLPKHVLERVHVKLLPANEGKQNFWLHPGSGNDAQNGGECDGWSAFLLGYEIDAPLTAVVHPVAMDKYQYIFKFLFHLKHVEWMLNNTWRQNTMLNHSIQHIATKNGKVSIGSPVASSDMKDRLFRMKLLLRKLSMTRSAMLHFATNLQSHLMFEVLENGWKQLLINLKAAVTLDEVIWAHNYYLDDIETKSLLRQRPEEDEHNLALQLRLVLSVVYRFCEIHKRIFSDALQAIETKMKTSRMREQRVKGGKWGVQHYDESLEEGCILILSDMEKLEEVETISNEFDDTLQNLLTMLNESVNNAELELVTPSHTPKTQDTDVVVGVSDKDGINKDAFQFLTFRLDYSEYYSAGNN